MKKKVVVRHFHEGNDADRAVRGRASYATLARVVDLETGNTVTGTQHIRYEDEEGLLVEEIFQDQDALIWAFCSPHDTPTRSQGRVVAIGRLQKQFPEVCADADFGVFKDLKVTGAA